MQYILDEKEMQDVRALRAILSNLPSEEKLQQVCTKIANEWATWKGWEGKDKPQPWGCVLTEEYEHYCDECPVESICPNPDKEWSK